MTTDYLTPVTDRIERLLQTRACIKAAQDALTEASEQVHAAWEGWDTTYQRGPKRIDAVRTLLDQNMDATLEDLWAAARQAGHLLARDHIVPVARDSNEAVTFITGNSMLPALRNFDAAESIWQNDSDGDVWEAFVEAVDSKLDESKVLMASPEYDNCLYVVNLVRWGRLPDEQIAELPEDATLSDEWYEHPF